MAWGACRHGDIPSPDGQLAHGLGAVFQFLGTDLRRLQQGIVSQGAAGEFFRHTQQQGTGRAVVGGKVGTVGQGTGADSGTEQGRRADRGIGTALVDLHEIALQVFPGFAPAGTTLVGTQELHGLLGILITRRALAGIVCRRGVGYLTGRLHGRLRGILARGQFLPQAAGFGVHVAARIIPAERIQQLQRAPGVLDACRPRVRAARSRASSAKRLLSCCRATSSKVPAALRASEMAKERAGKLFSSIPRP